MNEFEKIYSNKKYYYGKAPSGGLIYMVRHHNIAPCKALDLGSGEGRNSIWLAENGFDVYTIDRSKNATLKTQIFASEKGVNLNLINEDFLFYDFPKNFFGLIVALTSLNHIERKHVKQLISKLISSLEHNGFFYIVSFTREDPGYKRKNVHDVSPCANLVKYYFKKNELKKFLKKESKAQIIYYKEYLNLDKTHGKIHTHGKVKCLVKKI